MAFHRCEHCGCETSVIGGDGLGVFEDNPQCRQCGLSASEGDSKMQDELVGMMSSHLHLSAPQTDASMPPTPQVSPQTMTYITQHYHHSSHQVSPLPEMETSTILREAGVNASVLLPSQLSLFKHADNEQRQRLMELWTISPPQFGQQLPAGVMGNWPQTSMEQEETAARQRWEKNERERLKNLCALPGYDKDIRIEGVSNDGSEQQQPADEYKHCKDPVYNNSREWWQLSDHQPVEHQYGMYMQQMVFGQGSKEQKNQQEDTDMW